jgi:hypothetical protein
MGEERASKDYRIIELGLKDFTSTFLYRNLSVYMSGISILRYCKGSHTLCIKCLSVFVYKHNVIRGRYKDI